MFVKQNCASARGTEIAMRSTPLALVTKDFVVDFAKRGAARRDAPIVELAKIMANANVMKDLRASFVSERPAQIIATAVVTALLVHASAVLDGRVLGVLQEVVRTTAVVWVFVKLAFAHASTAIRVPTVRQNHAPVGLVGNSALGTASARIQSVLVQDGTKIHLMR